MTTFELDYRNFECLTQRHQLSTIFNSTIEEFFETLVTEYVDMLTAHSMVEPIIRQNYGNKAYQQNGKNQRQYIQKTDWYNYILLI